MKKNVWTWMLAAGMVLAGCSDDLDENGGGGNNPSATGEGYIKIALNLPSTSGVGTRTEANDQFNNGIGAEYNVGEDNYIFFFEGTTESSATYRGAYKLTGLDFSNANADPSNVTTTSSVIMEAPVKTMETNKMYVLVILNANGLVDISNGVKINNEDMSNPTLQSFYQKVLTLSTFDANFLGANKNTFLMTNAPIASLSGNNNAAWSVPHLPGGRWIASWHRCILFPEILLLRLPE